MSQSIIELRNVFYQIMEGDKERVLLNRINYSFEEGAITTISGPSGSGKTTLLYALSGLIDNVEGDIVVSGENVNALSRKDKDKYRLNNIGMDFQNLNLFSFMNVKENILVPLYLQNKKVTKELEKQLDDYLMLLNLGHIQDKAIPTLSGGEQQRVAILRALICNPKVVLCDEPTASLDHANAEVFMQTLTEIKKATGTSFIIATHDDYVYRYGEHRLRMIDGSVVES